MIKNLLVIVFTALIFITPSSALAQTVTTAPETTTSTTVTPTTATQRNNASSVGQAAREKAMAAKEAFKEKLSEVKDEKKKVIIDRIDTKIQTINEARTSRMTEYLEKITGVLERISTKEATLKEEGKNTATLLVNINAAETAIEKAKAAVEAQKEKVYNANITTDELLRTAVNSIISQFRTDILATFNLVRAARTTVATAHEEAKELENGEIEETATPSATTE